MRPSVPARVLFGFLFASAMLSARGGSAHELELVLGDLRPGSGLAAGVDYFHGHFSTGFFDLRLSTRLSTRLYQRHEAELAMPHFFHPKVFVEVLALYRSYTEVAYFGIGPETPESAHSNYRLQGPAFYATAGVRPVHKLSVGGRFGALRNSVGSGRSSDIPSIEEVFAPPAAPGIVEEPDYLLFGGFAAYDRRDDVHVPTRGAYYEVQATRYRARQSNHFDFDEVQIEAQHHLPLVPRITYASRVQGLFTRAGEGREIPFFLLPSLGGTHSLHAFENDRFRDRHLLFINNELRYQATLEVRLVAFVDLGQVAPSVSAFDFGDFELSTGIGAYYISGRRILTGVSLGIGREGLRLSMTGDFRF